MKTYSSSCLALLALSLVFCSSCSKSEPDPSAKGPPAVPATASSPAAGHWEGAIILPGTELAIRVDLAQPQGAWQGTIDIPVQGLRGFQLGDITVNDRSVTFNMPNIPGDPAFDGTLAEDGESIAGNFSQAGQTHTFKLARTEKKPEKGETPSKGTPGEGFAGVWQGSLRVNIVELRLLFKIQEEGGALSGTVDSIDQNANGIAITKATSAGGGRKLHLEVSSIGGTFDGELSADGSEIVGEWKQGGNTLPLTIRRLEKAPDLSRPQDPKQPVPYLEEEVAFENRSAGIKLAGTFTSPKSAGPHPAVVLISGSGAQDRDEAIMGHRPFLVLADHLTRHGIAVLRFDDRGVGKSEGSFSKATTKDFATDALAAVEHLKTRSNVDAKNIGLIGHSEGGIVAPMAAVQSQDVAFIVLLAGVGVPMEELLVRQGQDLLRVMGGSDEMITSQSATQREVFRIVREFGGTPLAEQKAREAMDKALKEFKPEQLEAMGWNEAQMDGQIKMVLSPWFRELLALDPRPTLEKVRCPVLALNGEKDIQVAAKENLEAIESALKRGGNTRVTVREFPGLNHLFQTCTTGAIAEYGLIEETFNPKALTAISDWIRSTTGLQ